MNISMNWPNMRTPMFTIHITNTRMRRTIRRANRTLISIDTAGSGTPIRMRPTCITSIVTEPARANLTSIE
jgi:hypothetical protein